MKMTESIEKEKDDAYIEWNLERRRRIKLAIIILTAFLGIGLTMFMQLNPDSYYFNAKTNRELFTLVIITVFGLSVLGLIMLYLQTGFKKVSKSEVDFYSYRKDLENLRYNLEKSGRIDKDRLESLQKELSEIKNEFAKVSVSSEAITAEQKNELLESLKARLQSDATSEFLKEIKESLSVSLQKDSRIGEINKQFNQTIERLNRELASLSRRGNLNLSLGIATTVAGLIILGYFVLSNKNVSDSLITFVPYFVPRLSLVIFIELFAYFFLKLYKSSLSEIKYFQNEMTNVEAKQISLVVALGLEDKKVCEGVISCLSATERNYKLEKGQTTIDLEQSKLDKEAISEMFDKLLNVFKKSK
jgi:hypothetical protein